MQGSSLWTSARRSTPPSQTSTQLTVPAPTCQWITNLLTDRRQQVRLRKLTSSTGTMGTGAPQRCVLSPLLFSLYTNDCTSGDQTVKLLKFADDTTVIGLIRDGDESAYRRGVGQPALWCGQNNLELTTLHCPPITISNNMVSAVEAFRFLGSTISPDLKWGVQHRHHHQKGPAEDVLPVPAQEVQPASGAADPVLLCTSVTVWFGSATRREKKSSVPTCPPFRT
ncbi:uncharacterized protein LOC122865444 [Siniperca chuatsi]|uniref:uncharacterized protein LOC122865444 n=1 Tax=Siniperca chuatsi TaxID=119488 RepID=UPI001CE0DFA2|nr:uncharacterized protein LOC122865444 [Siniperca chuatsi]